MATSQAASSGTAAAVGRTAAAVRETVVGTHMMKIDAFSGTKDLGVGKSIKSSTFNVGGHSWYIECYPCGDGKESAGWVSLFLCLLSAHEEQVEAECKFYARVNDELYDHHLGSYKRTYNAESSWQSGGNVMEREELESLLKDDCFPIICDVYFYREFPAVPPPDMHRPLSGLLAGVELFTLHRGLPGPSTQLAASKTTATGARIVATISAKNVAGSHVLTIEGYSEIKKAYQPDVSIDSKVFHVGGHRWNLEFYPSGVEDKDTEWLPIFLVNKDYPPRAVKVLFELTLLTLAREVISFTQSCYTFREGNYRCRCCLPCNMETEFSPLQDNFHVKCDVTIVKEITPLRQLDLQLHIGNLLSSQVGADVEFEVGGVLFSAHKCMLATRSTAFMAMFFGPPGKGSSTAVTRVQIEDMEPRVFKALLHFIYTDALPDVCEDDKVVMAQGLLVAADRYAMERLKLICGDMLCCYINNARTAITTLDLADKHGCRRLREACKKFLMDNFAKDAP